MITRNGICYDLKVSPYTYKLGGIKYVFSSQLHLEKFKKGYADFRKETNKKLTNRYSIECTFNQLSDITFYQKIETRGFLIQLEGGEYLCKSHIILNGERATMKTLNV